MESKLHGSLHPVDRVNLALITALSTQGSVDAWSEQCNFSLLCGDIQAESL